MKVVAGLFLALLMLSLAGAATAKYFITRLSELPERPVFDNDAPIQPEATAPSPAAQTVAEPEPAPEPAQSAPADELYQAVVIYPDGLIMRAGPGTDHEQTGGVAFDQTLSVLAEDAGWLKIKTQGGRTGWVKGGSNTKRLD
ncbi:MAG: SH3 domain-containing protein [Leptolyngbya sp. SIO4C1]|nr:SH3 domain-containing protein [Leptolyngbya sp. SIO4C1]